jgi:hypothetical protein
MCLAVNDDEYNDFPIQSMNFFETIYEARISALDNTVTVISHNGVYSTVFVDIYRLPFGENIYYGEDYINLKDHFMEYHVETKIHPKLRALQIIQREYKKYFKKKMDAILFLQYHLRKAIANPYTRLCRKRLLREFNSM